MVNFVFLLSVMHAATNEYIEVRVTAHILLLYTWDPQHNGRCWRAIINSAATRNISPQLCPVAVEQMPIDRHSHATNSLSLSLYWVLVDGIRMGLNLRPPTYIDQDKVSWLTRCPWYQPRSQMSLFKGDVNYQEGARELQKILLDSRYGGVPLFM